MVADASGVVREVRLERHARRPTGDVVLLGVAAGRRLGSPRTTHGRRRLDVEVAWRAPGPTSTPRVGLVAIHATGTQGEVDAGGRDLDGPGPGRPRALPRPRAAGPRRGRGRGPGRPHGPAQPVVRTRLSRRSPGPRHPLGDRRRAPRPRRRRRPGDPAGRHLRAAPHPGDRRRAGGAGSPRRVRRPDRPARGAPGPAARPGGRARLPRTCGSAPPTRSRRPTSLRHLLPANARIDTAADAAGRTVLATAALAWWLGAAGCGLLALLTLVTVGRGQLRSRRGDVAILRALGLTVREQQVLRGRELAWTTVFGLAAGMVAGVAVAVLVVPQLARAAVPEPYPTIATGLGRAHAGPPRRCRRAGGSAGARRGGVRVAGRRRGPPRGRSGGRPMSRRSHAGRRRAAASPLLPRLPGVAAGGPPRRRHRRRGGRRPAGAGPARRPGAAARAGHRVGDPARPHRPRPPRLRPGLVRAERRGTVRRHGHRHPQRAPRAAAASAGTGRRPALAGEVQRQHRDVARQPAADRRPAADHRPRVGADRPHRRRRAAAGLRRARPDRRRGPPPAGRPPRPPRRGPPPPGPGTAGGDGDRRRRRPRRRVRGARRRPGDPDGARGARRPDHGHRLGPHRPRLGPRPRRADEPTDR